MAFPQRFMDELAARSDIVDVVGGYVTLTAKGGSYWACCPFHSEKTPSFHVLPDKQMYYCFGCKKGGDVIGFIMEEENLSYPDAVRFLAKRAGLEVPDDGGDRREARRRARMLELNRDAARFFYRLLGADEGRAVREYLERRRISPKIARRFGMGAAADDWDVLLNEMTKQGYSKADLLDAGLVVNNKKGGLYDKFRNRLMLPVIDVRGDVVGFGSRVLDKSEPKYMNSPDTPVYNKRRILYGLNLAKKTKRPNLILCEGNLDVVTLHQAGFDNAVASMGTALTEEQVRLLSRYTKELVLCYDNDGAGKTATERALGLLHNADFTVRVLQLPRRLDNGEYVKQDPDDFIKYQGPDAFERLLSGSETGMDFRMEQIAQKYDLKSDEGRLAYSAEAGTLIASMRSSVSRDIYTRRAAEAAGVSKEAMEADVQRAAKDQYRRDRRTEERKGLNPVQNLIQPKDRSLRYENPRSARAEERVLQLVLTDEGLPAEKVSLTEKQFSVPLYGRAYTLLMGARDAGRHVGLGILRGELSEEQIKQIVSICQNPMESNRDKTLTECVSIIQEEANRRVSKSEKKDPILTAMESVKNKKGTFIRRHNN